VAQRHRSLPIRRSSSMLPWLVWIVIVVAVTVRAVVRDDALWYALSALKPPSRSAFLDPLYFAVAIPHVSWCYYIMRHDVDIYRYGDRRRLQKAQSAASTLLLLLWIAIGMSAIEWWMVAIALGGLSQALKSLAYGYDDRPLAVARVWRTGGWRTLGNVSIVLGFGVFFGLYVPHAGLSERAITGRFYLCSLPLFICGVLSLLRALVTGSSGKVSGAAGPRTTKRGRRALETNVGQ
jgi:hypothetical protein